MSDRCRPSASFRHCVPVCATRTAASPFRAVLIRTIAFILFTISAWALLPLIARNELGGRPRDLRVSPDLRWNRRGGRVMILPRLQAVVSRDRLVLIASMVYALTMAALATVRSEAVLYGVMIIAGAAWVTVLSSLQVAAQVSVPAWVRGRALSLYIMVFSAGLTLGSLLWGWVAAHAGIPAALLGSAAGAMLAALAVRGFSLGGPETPDLSPSFHWPTSRLRRASWIRIAVRSLSRSNTRSSLRSGRPSWTPCSNSERSGGGMVPSAGVSLKILPYQEDISSYSSKTHG